jgi:hypothetical protein
MRGETYELFMAYGIFFPSTMTRKVWILCRLTRGVG